MDKPSVVLSKANPSPQGHLPSKSTSFSLTTSDFPSLLFPINIQSYYYFSYFWRKTLGPSFPSSYHPISLLPFLKKKKKKATWKYPCTHCLQFSIESTSVRLWSFRRSWNNITSHFHVAKSLPLPPGVHCFFLLEILSNNTPQSLSFPSSSLSTPSQPPGSSTCTSLLWSTPGHSFTSFSIELLWQSHLML